MSEAIKVEKMEKIRFKIAYQPDLLLFSLSGKMGFEFVSEKPYFCFSNLNSLGPRYRLTLFTLNLDTYFNCAKTFEPCNSVKVTVS